MTHQPSGDARDPKKEPGLLYGMSRAFPMVAFFYIAFTSLSRALRHEFDPVLFVGELGAMTAIGLLLWVLAGRRA